MPQSPDFGKKKIDFIPINYRQLLDYRQLREAVENAGHTRRMAELKALIADEEARHAKALAEITGEATPTIPRPNLRGILARPQILQKDSPFIGDDGRKYWSLEAVMAANREYRERILPKISSSVENIKRPKS